MATILAWLKSKNWSTHAIGGTLFSIAVFITSDAQAQQFLVTLLQKHPAIAAQIVVFAGIIVAYKKSSSPAGTVAQSNAIMESPNPPTKSQVKAADTKIPPAE